MLNSPRRASPRLKDASLPQEDIASLYQELVLMVRQMFNVCKLVHADLSEYNLLYHEGHIWIIDVSQSVEHDHPSAFDFLRNDIKNVEDFFSRLGVSCLGLRRCFEFVTKEKLTEEEGVSDEEYLQRLLAEKTSAADEPENDEKEGPSESKEDAAHEDSVFLRSFIPRTLNEVFDPERDVEKHKRGDELIYADTIGLVPLSDVKGGTTAEEKNGTRTSITTTETEPSVRFEDREDQTSEIGDNSAGSEDEESDSDASEEEKPFVEKKPRGHRHEDKEAKKVSLSLIIFFPFFTLEYPLIIFSSNTRSVRSRSKPRRKRSEKIKCRRLRRSVS